MTLSRRKRNGFTLVELLTVLAIITMLVGLLVPSLATVRKLAKITKQKANLNSIDVGLSTFRNDNGYYPPSSLTPPGRAGNYCGAQKLAEALVGRDLMGFDPDSGWDLLDGAYDVALAGNLEKRKERYVELGQINPFRLGQRFDNIWGLAPETFVLCDVFSTKITLPDGRTVKAGAPILYYRANTSASHRIYNIVDNDYIVRTKAGDDQKLHPLQMGPGPDNYFYEYIQDLRVWDPTVPDVVYPYRPDSYLLITAGPDGIYGTGDDIRNFGN
ncbi:MAG: type II secretion system protein [Planctomycetota bacterium]|jgi:prepilin-type N-terminal cleavage/methylation domain-containing protein